MIALQTRRLPRPDFESSPLGRVLAARRSIREYGSRQLTLDELSFLLWAGQGITSRDGERVAPSAGAIYPITLSVADAEGVWRYVPGGHALERVAAEDRRKRLAAATSGQEFLAGVPAIVAVTGAPAALATRYGARAERYCTLEAGHVAQNILLAAASLGLGSVPVTTFEDAVVLRALDVGADHLAAYLLPVGSQRSA
jgi:SagB-type dehydrogenase family enzyme